MKPAFFKVILFVFLILEPVEAMMEDEESSKQTSIKYTQQKASKEKTPPSGIATIESLPDELFLAILRFVEIPDFGSVTQVSTRWKRVIEVPGLWRYIGLKYYGDYLNEEDLIENPRQKVISHYLSVIMNATENLKQVERMVNRYQLNMYVLLFKKYVGMSLITPTYVGNTFYITDLSSLEELIIYGNKGAIERKIEGLKHGKHGYEKNPIAAREFNNQLVEKGDTEAIGRKIRGLRHGRYGYNENSAESRDLVEFHVENGNPEAINCKLLSLTKESGKYKNATIGLGTSITIPILIYPPEYMMFNELLIEKGNAGAIERKIEGLAYGNNGYERNLLALREFNEVLVEKGNAGAIERKIEGLAYGDNGYEKNPIAAKEFIEELVEKGNSKAIIRKIEYLSEGRYGYERNPLAARELNELLVEQGNPEAIQRKIEGLLGKYNCCGYIKNSSAAREFIESLVICEFPVARAIGKYIKAFAMKYGVTQAGYEKDRKKAFEFIRTNHVPY